MASSINITKDTKLSQLLKECPQIIDEMIKINPQAKSLKNPVFRMMLGNLTIHELCEHAKINENLFINNFNMIIKKLGNK